MDLNSGTLLYFSGLFGLGFVVFFFFFLQVKHVVWGRTKLKA